jgi:hypothetical protein
MFFPVCCYMNVHCSNSFTGHMNVQRTDNAGKKLAQHVLQASSLCFYFLVPAGIYVDY